MFIENKLPFSGQLIFKLSNFIRMKYILTVVLLLLLNVSVHAQSYKWITGGGSTVGLGSALSGEQVKFMCTDSNKNIYIISPIGNYNLTADTFYRSSVPKGNPHIFLASYNC